MKTKKLQPTFKPGDLVRHKETWFADDWHGDLCLVLSVVEEEEKDGQGVLWGGVKVYSFPKGMKQEYFPDTLCKVGESGGEWYEVGLGNVEADDCADIPLVYIE